MVLSFLLRRLAVSALFVPVLAMAGPQAAMRARDLAANCTTCHARGAGLNDAIPALAGRPAADIIKAMRAFVEVDSQATVMPQIARGYSAAQIAQIAKYFAARGH